MVYLIGVYFSGIQYGAWLSGLFGTGGVDDGGDGIVPFRVGGPAVSSRTVLFRRFAGVFKFIAASSVGSYTDTLSYILVSFVGSLVSRRLISLCRVLQLVGVGVNLRFIRRDVSGSRPFLSEQFNVVWEIFGDVSRVSVMSFCCG